MCRSTSDQNLHAVASSSAFRKSFVHAVQWGVKAPSTIASRLGAALVPASLGPPTLLGRVRALRASLLGRLRFVLPPLLFKSLVGAASVAPDRPAQLATVFSRCVLALLDALSYGPTGQARVLKFVKSLRDDISLKDIDECRTRIHVEVCGG
jgi:hypothetical protein